MEHYTWWLTIALCFSALVASKGEEVDDSDQPDVTEDDKDKMELPYGDFMDTNPKEVNGQPIFERDMLLTPSQWRAIRERKGIASLTSRWTEGTDGCPLVPYIFNDNNLDTAAIENGMKHWMDHTCIKFQETNNTDQSHLRYIFGSGCYSYVGMLSTNGQDISIGNGCNGLGTVAHEIGHAIGFFHEQSRPDRDDYVIIIANNIQSGRGGNFDKYSRNSVTTENIPYDYSSDMHYGSTYFTINGKATIVTIDRLAQELIGQRTGLSHRDKLLANIMYNCTDKWLAKCGVSPDPCLNGGYLGADCKCVCPPGTSGNNCETQTEGYYDSLRNLCTENVTTEGTLTSPNYPYKYPQIQCVKWIQAPHCHVPRLIFSEFQLHGKNNYCANNACCYFDALEIFTSTNESEVFCGTDISAGYSITGTNNEIVLFFRTKTNFYKGWSANLTFVKQEGCEIPTTLTTTTESTTTETTATESTTTVTTTMESTITETTTTESTTTETTTPEPIPVCSLKYYNGTYYWSSPWFGIQKYPNNFTCGIRGSSSIGNVMLTMTLQSFHLQGRKRKQCRDAVATTLLYNRTRTLCGKKSGKIIRSPSFNFDSAFFTDEAITKSGFNISISSDTTPCHQVINSTANVTGTVSPPRNEKYCEYRIVAPSGSQVKINFIESRVKWSKNCKKDFILLNGSSKRMYPVESSKIFCGKKTFHFPMTSTAGQMYVAYKGTHRKSTGFDMEYTIVLD